MATHEQPGYQPNFVERHPSLKEVVDQGLFPQSIAIIPDNNRTLALELGLESWEGHFLGVRNMIELIREYRDSPADSIVLWGASVDNLLKRPEEEVARLKGFIKDGLIETKEELTDANSRLIHIGRKDPKLLSEGLLEAVEEVEEATRENTGQRLYLALAYSAEDHYVRSSQKLVDYIADLVRQNPNADVSSIVNGEFMHRFDDGQDSGWKNVDLLIRTRLEKKPEGNPEDDDDLDPEEESAYQKIHLSGIGDVVGPATLIYTVPIAFPSFKPEHLDDVIKDFAKTKRKQGA